MGGVYRGMHWLILLQSCLQNDNLKRCMSAVRHVGCGTHAGIMAGSVQHFDYAFPISRIDIMKSGMKSLDCGLSLAFVQSSSQNIPCWSQSKTQVVLFAYFA